MKQRTNVLRLVFTVMLALVATLVLVACGGNTDAKDVADAKEALVIGYTTPDTKDSVTRNLDLPTTGLKGVTITWSSNAPTIITNAGQVIRPSVDTSVTLTASLSKGGATDNKIFAVTVVAAEATLTPEQALAALEITGTGLTYDEDKDEYTTVNTINLPTTVGGHSVEWFANSPVINAQTGVVTQPAYGLPAARVTLEASIGNAEREFIIIVPALETMPAAQVVDLAHGQLIISTAPIREDITLPTSVVVEDTFGEVYNVTVTWVSSEPDLVGHDGKVGTLPDEETPITLTATLSYQGETKVKEFSLIVTVLEEAEEVENFAEAFNVYKETSKPYVQINGVSVVYELGDGVMLVDAAGELLFAYDNGNGSWRGSLDNTKLYNVRGVFDVFYGSKQLSANDSNRPPISFVEVEGDAHTVNFEEVAKLTDLTPATAPDAFSVDNPFEYKAVRLTAKVLEVNQENYGVLLVDPDFDGNIADLNHESGTPYENKAAIVYYSSNLAAIRPFKNTVITIDLVLYSYRTDRFIYTFVFGGEIEDIDGTPDTAAIFAGVKNELDGIIPGNVTSARIIDLVPNLLGTTITWQSSNEEVIDLEGNVTPVEGEIVEVELTATIKFGEATETHVITVKVGELNLSTVAQALALGEDAAVKVQGHLVGYSANNTLVLHDETGAIAIFVGGNQITAEVANQLKGAIGKEVLLEGFRTEYQGLEQIQHIYAVQVLTVDPTPAIEVDITEVAWTPEALLTHQNKLVSIVDGVVSAVDVDSHGNVKVTITLGDKTIDIRWDNRVTLTGGANVLATAVVGDVINVIDAPLSWTSNTPQIGYYVSGQVTLEADPNLERHDVVFMDGEEEVETTQAVHGRTILEYPTMTKEGFVFMGWFEEADLTNEWDHAAVVEEDLTLYAKWAVEAVIAHHEFWNGIYDGQGTGYAAGELTWDETFGSVTVNKDRVQINKSNFAPHDNQAMLVFSIRNTHHTAWMEFDFTSYESLSRISFEASVWNQTHFTAVTTVPNGLFALQVDVDGTWVRLGDNLLSTMVVDQYTEFSFDVDGPGKYRLVYSGESTINGNTTTALTVDNLKLYGPEKELENPVSITFDLNYDGAAEPTVVTIGKDELVNVPGNPTRTGFNFIGWALEGETELFDFETPITEDITLVALWEAAELLSIADARALPAGTWVEFVGVVTGFSEYNSEFNNHDYIYLQDDTAAINVYRVPQLEATVGAVYSVLGRIDNFNGLIQIASGSATLTLLEEETMTVPTPIVVENLADIDATYQSKKVSFDAVVKSVSSNGQTLTVTLGEVDIQLRTAGSSGVVNDHFKTAIVGQPVSVVGAYVGWFNGAQLSPHYVEEVLFLEFTDELKVAAAKENLTLADEYNVEFTLPTEGLHGVVVVWTADPAASLVEGKLVIPEEGQVVVTLTATLTLGEVTDTKVFEVTLKEAEVGVTETVIAKSAGGSTNMTAGSNPASSLELNEAIFEVSVNKGTPSSIVGLYADLRLYGDRNSGDGNELVISVKEGFIITKVEIVFGSSTNEYSSRITLGETVNNLSKAETTGTVTYDELLISSFAIKNTGEGGSSNPQVRINEIIITYATAQ